MNIKLKQALVAYPGPAYEVAKKLGVHHSTMSKFLSGLQKPTEEQKEKLAIILKVSVEDLFNGEEKR